MRPIALLAAVLLAVLLPADSGAQRRSPLQQQQPDARPDCEPRRSALAMAPEPYGTLERELPSLRVDLKLAAGQLDRWRAFERDVRVVAELDRHRLRQMLPLRDTTREAPQAPALLSMLAELDRRKSEATQAMQQNLAALYAGLDEAQKKMLDRRVLLSQADPLILGREARRD